MSPTIAVSSGCQSGAIAAALSGMLPDQAVQVAMPFGADATDSVVGGAAVWITSLDPDAIGRQTMPGRSSARVVRIPNIYFRGFHPDIFHTPAPDGSLLGSAAGDYSSAIVLYGWKKGLDVEQIRRCFRAEVYDALGYFTNWAPSVTTMSERFAASDMNFAHWYLPLARRSTFMLTDNHPALAALVQLARQIGASLGADPQLLDTPWELLIPDGLLATSTVWPVYPELAAVLGVPGGYVWRSHTGELLGLDEFIEGTLHRYQAMDPTAISGPPFLDNPQIADLCGVSDWRRAR